MDTDGTVDFPCTVCPNIVLPFAGTPSTVMSGATRSYAWDTATTDGRYAVVVTAGTGTRFARRHAGRLHRPVRGRACGPRRSAGARRPAQGTGPSSEAPRDPPVGTGLAYGTQ
ncbi:hypothetical protein GCM10010495_58570 [Kitasatospora herbaricolor]|uniref:phospholipase domain-containing protein n=1 Tax=Kitasatospora herbaricolor TaxID=68217 RepID=UPI00174ADC64|nr:phospholipase domain-containing protein [Kitasatospora herbaricolor]MDQ0306612.1 hypothetical protein [Kitasatospora herbaricolor]GGV33948.1 hypothetical protein GCM10010495_58570 [Kitasatospora herbaricolor]